ncbi:type II toxin-antitoxin system Phd/YefM family antitoxin [Streptomyces triticagri]|uniref:Antitoxin n=1 Tax=Streptomyces triticagri TaxID=2293568 RepID=A0A372LWT8_9ACTN|nr:type II toxin-antitoxin system prevent-host-death family antitoxin [Streptomyces triticagri]RFU82477.1 type II toxin-antitoxin system Phd/YefM family antitoxin [Streptomyces triticagri]
MTVMPISEARKVFGPIVRAATVQRERTYISDHGQTSAVVMSVADLEDLEDTIAVLEHELRRARGETIDTVPLAEVKKQLGL